MQADYDYPFGACLIQVGLYLSYANRVDPDQMPHFAASDLGLHYLLCPIYGKQSKNRLGKRIKKVSDLN